MEFKVLFCTYKSAYPILNNITDYCYEKLADIVGEENIISEKKGEKEPLCIFTYYKQLLRCLESLQNKNEVIYVCEHDVLYHQSYFDFKDIEKDFFYYNVKFYCNTNKGYIKGGSPSFSQCVCYSDLLSRNLKQRILYKDSFNLISTEPGVHEPDYFDKFKIAYYQANFCNIDIRHGYNLTGQRDDADESRYIDKIEYWGDYRKLRTELNIL